MCLIAFHWDPASPVPLVVAANRDEFYDRPAAPQAWWEGGRILAGRDLRAGGTWLGVTAEGRCAALTNFRDPQRSRVEAPSRGLIPVRFLEGNLSAATFLEELRLQAPGYNAFNLLLYDGTELAGYESRHDRVLTFAPGIHAVSNGDFDEPWPKVAGLLADLVSIEDDDEALLARLADARSFPDDRLPHTGVPLEWERRLSPAFIRSPTYGTRASTILRLGREAVSMLEQRHSQEGRSGRSRHSFRRS